MCLFPSNVWVKRGPKWEQTPVPCDMCKLCKQNRVNDWVGRCLAEASTSEHVATVSLTYAPRHDWADLSDKVVNVTHFQLFIKRLRKAGHKIRYFVAGEYGDLRGRAHFHVILFFTKLCAEPSGRVPYLDRKGHASDPDAFPRFCREIPQEEMVHISEWPHGHIIVDWSCSERGIKYVCEYLTMDDKSTAWFSMSKKPALGAAWFANKAALSVEHDVLPSSFEYLPPGGQPGRKYLMTGATRRDYLNAITLDRADRPQMSEWVAKTFDKIERQEYIDACDTSVPWPDDHFSSRGLSLEQMSARLLTQDAIGKIAEDAILLDMASRWGFDNVEEWQGFIENGGATAHPEYYIGPTRDVSRSSGQSDAGKRSAPSGLRTPTEFDRQGRPAKSNRTPFPDAFARTSSGNQKTVETLDVGQGRYDV